MRRFLCCKVKFKNFMRLMAVLIVITFAVITVPQGVKSSPAVVQANSDGKQYVYAGGYQIGVYLKYEGILVAKIAEFKDMSGMTISPSKGILKNGDIIYAINGEKVSSKEEFSRKILECGNDSVILSLKRNGEDIKIRVTPEECMDGMYKLGVWVRDDTQGIGTMTYVTKDNEFGALGHGVNDVDTHNIAYISGGKLYEAKILGIRKGVPGNAGELIGAINYNKKYELGVITSNSAAGIYGKLMYSVHNEEDNLYMVGEKYDVKKGEAYIISYVEGEKKLYEINITELDYNASNTNKGIKFEVVDSELIKITGGIVQGMSGSPIIQDGKIIGAVTHVLVSDPQKGYAIFIQNMIK